jgi:hypothetical protein
VSIEQYDTWRELDSLRKTPGISEEARKAASDEADKIHEDLRFYNLQDVWSTRGLYRWLEGLEGSRTKYGESRKKKEDEEDRRSAKAIEALAALHAHTQALFDKVADHEWGKDVELDYRAQIWLALTHSILFYKREDVMFWADLSMRVSMEDEILELVYPLFNIFMIHSFIGHEHQEVANKQINKINQSIKNPLIFLIIHDESRKDNDFTTSNYDNIVQISLGRYNDLLGVSRAKLRSLIV